MVAIDQLTVEFGGNPLFDDISFLINPKEKVALVGKNGAGKTTLLKILAGKQSPTRGGVTTPKDFTIGYLPQQMMLNDNLTVMQEAELAFREIIELQHKVEALTNELAERTDYDSEAYHDLIERMTHENERLQMIGAANFQAQIERTLTGLGFERSDFDRPTREFSGGWRMRIELAKILLRQPDLLLLDEPTNHLDIESIQWLESFLASSSSALILVSHDRAFLDAVTTRTIEISLGKIYDYKVSYTQYVSLRAERREQQLRAYENQQKMIAETEDFIERFRYKATKAVQVQSRIKQLEKVDRIEVDLEDNSKLSLKFQPAPHSGVLPVEIENLSKWYGDKLILKEVSMHIRRGDKVAFVGKNGAGKSTLVRCIMNEIECSGLMRLGHQVKIGYFAQNQASLLDGNRTVFETIDYVAVGDIRTKIRDILGAFMFGGEASDKKVNVLSGGERSRLAMIKLLLEPVNLLILDEPTNHLDMRSKEVLKTAIQEFEGTVILVSHDRDFLDGLVSKVYEFQHQKVTEHLGGIREFLEHKKLDSLKTLEIKTTSSAPAEEKQLSDNKLSYEARKELNKKIKRIEKQIEEAENAIQSQESIISSLEERMANGESSAEIFDQYPKAKHDLEKIMYEWEILCESLEELNAQQ